jgi:hypothetical protein
MENIGSVETVDGRLLHIAIVATETAPQIVLTFSGQNATLGPVAIGEFCAFVAQAQKDALSLWIASRK